MAIAVEDVSSLLALVGAACATPLMTVFPPLMLLRTPSYEGGGAMRALHATLCALGVLATLAATTVSVLDALGVLGDEDAMDSDVSNNATRRLL